MKAKTKKRKSEEFMRCTEGELIFGWKCPHGLTKKVYCCDKHLAEQERWEETFAMLCRQCNPPLTEQDVALLKSMGISLDESC
jgi:hypothetical protein